MFSTTKFLIRMNDFVFQMKLTPILPLIFVIQQTV